MSINQALNNDVKNSSKPAERGAKRVSGALPRKEGSAKPSSKRSKKRSSGPYKEGQVIGGRYRLIKEIGQGGMGIVWCAEDKRLYDRLVALKFIKIHADQRKNQTSRHRFMREAFLSSQLSHPNFATIYEFFEHTSDGQTPTGEWVMVFEYIAGETLAKYIHRERKLDPLTVCHIALQLSHALGHMHGLGLLHRDLKPENIMLTALQEPSQYLHLKLLDLGIAKVLPNEEEVDESTKDRMLKTPLTATGYVCGTPEYMSPQQTRGEPLTIASDIYAVGILIFEMLAGVPPLKCKEWAEFLTKRSINHIPEVSSYTSYHIPQELNLLLKTCLAFEPSDRFKDTNELSMALEEVLFKCYAQILPLSNLHLSPTGRQELSVLAEQRSGHPLELIGSDLNVQQRATVPPAELKIEERPVPISSAPSRVDFDIAQAPAMRSVSPSAERSAHGSLTSRAVDAWFESADQLAQAEESSVDQAWIVSKFYDAQAQFKSADPSTQQLSWFAAGTVALFFFSLAFGGGRASRDLNVTPAPVTEQALSAPATQVLASSDVMRLGEATEGAQASREEELRRQTEEVRRVEREKMKALQVKQLYRTLEQRFSEARDIEELRGTLTELKSSGLSSPELAVLRTDVNRLIELISKVERLNKGRKSDKAVMRLLKRARYDRLKDHSLYKGWYTRHDTSLPPLKLDL